jgi:hypothetical protein
MAMVPACQDQRALLQPTRGSADCVVDQVKLVIIARLLGLTIPASLLALADEGIE